MNTMKDFMFGSRRMSPEQMDAEIQRNLDGRNPVQGMH